MPSTYEIQITFSPSTLAATRGVALDLDHGWSWGGAAWAKPVAPDTTLAPLLVSAPSL